MSSAVAQAFRDTVYGEDSELLFLRSVAGVKPAPMFRNAVDIDTTETDAPRLKLVQPEYELEML